MSAGCVQQSLTHRAVVSYNVSLYDSLSKCFLVVAARVQHGWNYVRMYVACTIGVFFIDREN